MPLHEFPNFTCYKFNDLKRWHQGATGTRLRRPVETPERPLLTDFSVSSPGTPGSVQQAGGAGQQGSNQHIYMEVMDPWRNDFYQTPVDSGYVNKYKHHRRSCLFYIEVLTS